MEAAKPGDPFLKFALAQEYVSNGDLAAAESCYTTLSESFPEYVAQYYHHGKLLERQQRYEEAVEVYERGIEVATARGESHLLNELKEALLLLQDEE